MPSFIGIEISDILTKNYPNTEFDVIYELGEGKFNSSMLARRVIVFENVEDCLSFTLKYGHKYGIIL
jgi:hypothetical protein